MCNSSDFEHLIGRMLQTSPLSSSLELIHVECIPQFDSSVWYNSAGMLLSLIVILAALSASLLANINIFIATKPNCSVLCEPLPLKRDIGSLLVRKRRPPVEGPSLACLDGVKAISGLTTIAFHSYNFGSDWLLFDNPNANEQRYSTIWTQWLANGSLLIANHVLIAGFLATYKASHQPVASGRLWSHLIRNCLLRYLRLTPILLLIILLSVNLLPLLSSGPNWTLATQMFSTWCEQGGWLANALQVQNRANPSSMCMPQSWYAAVDFQLFVCLQVLLALVAASKLSRTKLLCWILVAAAVACQFCLALIVYEHNITIVPCVPVGSLESLINFSSFVWVKPFHWFASYAIGCLLALQVTRVVNRSNRMKITTPKSDQTDMEALKWILQCMALAVLACLLFGSSLAYFRANAMPRFDSVVYALFVKPIWSCCVCVIIYFSIVSSGQHQLHKTSQLDRLINATLCSEIWFPLGKLNYLASLLNPLVIAAFYGSRTETFKYNHSLMLYFALGNIVLTYAASLVFHLLLELPLEIAIGKVSSRVALLMPANNRRPDC